MKAILIITLFFTNCSFLFGQINNIYNSIDQNSRQEAIFQLENSDLLIFSKQQCFSGGGSIFIDPCQYGGKILKVNSEGTLIWETKLPETYVRFSKSFLIEKNDGSFSLLTSANLSIGCNGSLANSYGPEMLTFFNFDAQGELIDQLNIPNECAFHLRNIKRLDSETLVVVGHYARPPGTLPLTNEGRVLLLSHEGEVLNEKIFDGITFYKARILVVDENEFKIFYNEGNAELSSKTFDDNLNIVSEQSNANDGVNCFTLDKEVYKLNSNYCSFCQDRNSRKIKWFEFTESLDVINSKSYNSDESTNFLIRDNDLFIGSIRDVDESMNEARLVNFSLDGDSISSRLIVQTGFKFLTKIILSKSEEILISGNLNCCGYNYDQPTSTFLLFENEIMGRPEVGSETKYTFDFGPNPTEDLITFSFSINGDYQFKLFSKEGVFLKSKIISRDDPTMDLTEYKNGIYVYQILKDQIRVDNGMIIKISN